MAEIVIEPWVGRERLHGIIFGSEPAPPKPFDYGDGHDLMTFDEWWAEFLANVCCEDGTEAAARLCGCGGSGSLPPGISRLLTQDIE